MRYPLRSTQPSPRPYSGLPELDYPFHDLTITVTRCGRICIGPLKDQSQPGVRRSEDRYLSRSSEKIWLVSFMHYDLGFFDHETCRIERAPRTPSLRKLLPMSPV